jgi:hypothetical protein
MPMVCETLAAGLGSRGSEMGCGAWACPKITGQTKQSEKTNRKQAVLYIYKGFDVKDIIKISICITRIPVSTLAVRTAFESVNR